MPGDRKATKEHLMIVYFYLKIYLSIEKKKREQSTIVPTPRINTVRILAHLGILIQIFLFPKENQPIVFASIIHTCF